MMQSTPKNDFVLKVNDLDVAIEHTPVLRHAKLTINAGEMVGLIGHNGAGKTTLMRSIMGLLPSQCGEIVLCSHDMTYLAAYRRAHLHIGYMPEDRKLIPDLSVEENIQMPCWTHAVDNDRQKIDAIYEIMPEVKSFAHRLALSLSGGQQKLVSLARALMVAKQLLLLDEPFEGVAPALSRRLANVLSDLKTQGMAVLIAESDDTHTRDLVDSIYKIERGFISKRERENE